MSLHPVLAEKLNAAILPSPPERLTPRDATLPEIPGKAHAVIGMRRAGKTTFLRQLRAERRQHRAPEQALFIGFDDDRLAGIDAEQLSCLLEEHYRRYPGLRGSHTVTWLLDEVQVVPGWERFVRRVLDSENVEIVVSGSSARMLSREVHTSLRGRAIATVLRPFSFREFLRHRGELPAKAPDRLTSAERSLVEKRMREYLVTGGFPEAQGLAPALRVELLQSYVDSVVYRDVIERHGVSQVAALRWLVRHCLRNPAGAISAHRLYNDLRSQGHAVGKDNVHAFLRHLEDAFLFRLVEIATDSERRRNSNPRKLYPVDPGLAGAFDASGRPNAGHALETVVLHEADRRFSEISYVRTTDGFEVDFLLRSPGAAPELVQVCSDTAEPGTLEREIRALRAAGVEHPRARQRLLVLLRDQVPAASVPGIRIQPAWEWLLEEPGTR